MIKKNRRAMEAFDLLAEETDSSFVAEELSDVKSFACAGTFATAATSGCICVSCFGTYGSCC